MKIAIIGCGNAGCAHAFKLTEIGHKVHLIKTSNSLHEENFQKISDVNGIWCVDDTQGGRKSFQKIEMITRDISKGLNGVDMIIVLTQSLHHENVAKLISRSIDMNSTKVLLCIPGNLGTLIFKKYILSCPNIIYAEGESTPYDARIIQPGVVHILFKNVRNAVAFLPVNRKNEGMRFVGQIADTYGDFRTNIVESALHNPNLVVHTVGVIMSANRIEMMKGEFWMYKESFSPSIWKLINQLDNEKNQVIEKFGGSKLSYLDACKYRNELDLTKDSLEVFKSYANHGGPKGPEDLNTRYLHEDVIVGLGLLSFLGEETQTPTPVTNSLITIASCLVDKDFHSLKRTKFTFGVSQLSFIEFYDLIN